MRRGALLFLLLIMGCGTGQVPADIIQPAEMQAILWDVARAESLSTDLAVKDSTLNKIAAVKVLAREVFALHHTSADAFEKSYRWYTAHPDLFKVMLDSMTVQDARAMRQEIIRNTRHPINVNAIKRKLKYE